MEAIQGNRSEPRNKPPRTVNSGLWGKPTALNNVETFTHAITILGKGGDWYHDFGRPGSPASSSSASPETSSTPASSKCPWASPIANSSTTTPAARSPGREIIGFAPSGPSSGYLPASLLDTPLDWDKVKALDSMLGSGAVVVVRRHRLHARHGARAPSASTATRAAANVRPAASAHKSSSTCSKTGSKASSAAGDQATCSATSRSVLRQASLCGLGQIAPAPIQSVMKHFPELMREHLEDHNCRAGICFSGARMSDTHAQRSTHRHDLMTAHHRRP